MKDKFILIEFSSVENQEDLTKYYENMKLNDIGLMLQNLGILEFYNYFYDHQCGYVLIKLTSGYMLQLYHDVFGCNSLAMSKSLEEFIKHVKSTIKHHMNDDFLIIDPEDIYTHLFLDCTIMQNIKSLNSFDILQTQNSKTLSINIFLPHNKFTKEECVYWSNYHLQTFVQFNKTIYSSNFVVAQNPALEYFDLNHTKTWFTLSRLVMKKALKVAKGNNSNITFLIDGCMEYNKHRNDIRGELYLLKRYKKRII